MSPRKNTLALIIATFAITLIALARPADAAEPPGGARAFLGSWEGSFNNGRPTWLIVENLTGENNVMVRYGVGKWGQARESEQRRQATIRDGVLRFELKNGAALTYRLRQDKNLEAHWARGAWQNDFLLTRAVGAPRKTASLDTCDDPLPNVIVIPPDANVPPHLARFSGIWRGRWNGIRCSRLAVDLVEATGDVRYVLSMAETRNREGDYRAGYGKIEDGKLEFGDQVKFSFSFDDGGILRGELQGTGRADIVLEKAVPKAR